MPRVPVISGPQVGVAPLNAPRLPALQIAPQGANEQRAAEALGAVSEAAFKIAQDKAIIRAGELEVEGQTGWLEEQARLTRERAGAKAAGVGEDVDKYWNDFRARIPEGTDPLAKRLADRALTQARLRARAWAAGFEQTELDRAAGEAFKASKQLAIDTESTDPAVLAEARDQIRQRNADWAVARGLGPEWVQATALADLTKLHTNVLTRLANDPINPERAQAYYLEHADEINDPGGAIKATVEEAVGIGKAQQVGLDVASQFSHLQTAQAVRAIQAREDLSQKQKDIAISRMEHMHAIQSADEDASNRRLLGQAQLAYERDGVVPPALMARLDPEAQAALLRQEKADTRMLQGGAAQTNYALYEELVKKINANPDAVHLDKHKGDIRTTDLDRLREIKLDRLRVGEANTADQQLSPYVDQLDVPSDAEEARQIKGAFRAYVHRQFQQFRDEEKRAPKFDEREAIITRAMVRERDRWFGRERYAFELGGDPEAELDFMRNLSPGDAARYVDLPPDADVAEIIRVLQSRGKAATPENIRRVYRAARTPKSAP